jgi:Family of unknown function (DUF6499)
MNNTTRDSHQPPTIETLQYLMTASKADWAWEYLRRNPEYKRQNETTATPEVVSCLPNAAKIFRAIDIDARADTWGLCCFRRR